MPHLPRGLRKVPVIRRLAPPGSSPGTLTADPSAAPTTITIIAYGPDGLLEKEVDGLDGVLAERGKWPVLWVNVNGVGDPSLIQAFGDAFGLHRLAVADVVHVSQRAKCEPYDDEIFAVARMVEYTDRLRSEQVSFFCGDDFVLTFQERPGDAFERVRERLRTSHGRIRIGGPGYLLYALIDAIIDGYYPVLEQFGDRIETLEDEVLDSVDPELSTRIHVVKRELLVARRALAPHREAVHELARGELARIDDSTRVHLRDCYDHVVQLMDMLEVYRELSSSLLDLYLSLVSNRMNEIMKVLTIFAAIFIPLSFIAGLYGMNFASDAPWSMPELRWRFGYPAVLLGMAVLAVSLLLFFRRRGWIGSGGRRGRSPR